MSDRAATYEQLAHRRAFGRTVAACRQERGWTQEDMAERSGLHRSYVAAIETGARNPTLDVIVKIAAALHMPVADLFQSRNGGPNSRLTRS